MMERFNVLKYVLCLLITASCAKEEKRLELEKGMVVITGRVSNLDEGAQMIRFAAESTIESIEKTAIIDSLGNFRLKIELYHPQNVQGFLKKSIIKLYLRPFDSIHLDIDASLLSKERIPDFRITGTSPDAEISNEIQKYLQYCGEHGFNPDTKVKSTKEFLQILKEQINLQDSILQTFSKEYNPSMEFEDWAKKDIKYGIANYLLQYKFANQGYEGDLFDKSIFPINDDDAIVSSLYPLHLKHYALNVGIWQDSVTLNHLKTNNNVEAYRRCMETIISSVEEGLSRDIMSFKLLSGLLNESYEDYEIVSVKIDSYIENGLLKKVLSDKAYGYKNQKALDISFFDSDRQGEKKITRDFWTELKEKHKGKVVYVDIWATWCGPCRGEIPHAIKLHNYFKGKDIAFVNLCLASDKDEWLKMIKNSNIKGDNYFFNKAQEQLLRDQLQFDGYPTYLITDLSLAFPIAILEII
ncbi:hypothetical protein FUAX_41230 (plasmid) [Fulvitalea axinellae]|uniref:Thioredoxin domain-containing protein n=1 Tax=Fulvitalea axinellae TaxID=1182444 RepID=A0AAU9CHQ4_9BACT|nr:hypothetical protein FUAX_41230 [Fulvitalea axinellae]